MDRLALVVAIEDHYEIAFEPEDEEEVRTLEDVIRTVHTKLTERASHA
jgi:acyl carrier protein